MAILIQYANGVPGVKFSLDQAEITIGRGLENDISIDDEFISKKHAVIQLVHDEISSELVCILIDNASTNHTYVNNVKVSAHQLAENDKVYIGQNEFRFSTESVCSSEPSNTRRDIFVDYEPTLVQAKIEQAASLPTTPFEAMTHSKSATEDSPRFSRRLSLI